MARCHTVFVDTSLDTHLMMVVEDGDTVADFKKKIQLEHTLCFPEMGQIGVNSLQVKRRGFLYHLPDSMCVKSAFDGVKGRWFVYVDACDLVKQVLEVTAPLLKENGVSCLERNVLEDRADVELDEGDGSLRSVLKDDCLDGKHDENAAADAVAKVLEDLEVEFEHMGDDHCRTSSCDTNKRVESDVDGGSSQIRELGKKRKKDDYEKLDPVDKNLLDGDFSSGQDNNGATTAKKRQKIHKKVKGVAKRSDTKSNNFIIEAPEGGARDSDTAEQLNVTTSSANNTATGKLSGSAFHGHEALDYSPSADTRIEPRIEPMNEDPVNILPVGHTSVLSNGEEALCPDPANEDSSMGKTTVNSKHFSGPDAIAASVSDVPTEKSDPSTKQKKKKTRSKTLQNQLPLEVPVPAENNDGKNHRVTMDSQSTDAAEMVNLKTSVTQNTEEALNNSNQLSTSHISSTDKNTLLPTSPAKMQLENPKLAGPSENDHVAEAPEVLHTDGVKVSRKSEKKSRKKKKICESHNEKNGGETLKVISGSLSTGAAEKVSLKTSRTQNTEEALNNSNQFTTSQISSIDKNTVPPSSPEKMRLENPKLAGPGENDHFADAPEVLLNDGARLSRKSEKKSRKEKKDAVSHKKEKTKPVTESVETIQVKIVGNPNTDNTGSKSERIDKSQSGLDGKSDRVEVSDAAERAIKGNSAMDDVIVTGGSDMHVGLANEANLKASQLKGSSDHENPVHAVEKDKKKSKRKRSAATNPSEIQLQENVVNPSQSIDDINSKDKSVRGEKEAEQATSVGTSTRTANDRQVEGKHIESVVGTIPLVDDSTMNNQLSSAAEDINFSDYFVPSQQKPEVVASGNVVNVNDERIAVKEKTNDSKVKKKSVVHDGKKSQVDSSQESLLMRQPHGAVLHSDTESFRFPKDRTPSNSGKQKLKSSNKKSKQTTSEAAALHSPNASETLKSTSLHEASKPNTTQSKPASRQILKVNAETFTASNSTLKSHDGVQQTKSRKPASNKSSAAKVKKAESAAKRRKTVLSANIFKDDNDESSEDDEAVTSGHSAGAYLDDPNGSDVSEMEDDDTGFATPITVGQRKAAEVDKDSDMINYTLEKLRESACLLAKRAQESGTPFEDFVPDSQADQH